jgi:hypothetical protein
MKYLYRIFMPILCIVYLLLMTPIFCIVFVLSPFIFWIEFIIYGDSNCSITRLAEWVFDLPIKTGEQIILKFKRSKK